LSALVSTNRSVICAAALAAGCQPSQPTRDERPASTSRATEASPSATVVQLPLADESVEIPGGAFHAGSKPGTPGRVPELEPRRYEVKLGPYQIDRLPYPNDPKLPPRVNVTREEALRLCGERDGRLCTELEWERACRGPESQPFSTGEAWKPECAKQPNACASGFDVLAIGASLREWVASDVIPEGDAPRRAVVRGAAAGEPAPQHRCATRRAISPDTASDDLGFRCCKGAPNAAVVEEPRPGAAFERTRLTAKRLTELLAAHPKTKVLARDVKFFREPDAANTVVARGRDYRERRERLAGGADLDDEPKGFSFTVAPLLWNPVPGSVFLAVAARSGDRTSFVVLYHVVGEDEYQLATSFVMREEPGPVAFAYSGSIRLRFHFSTCWGCPGETGKLLHRNPDSAIALQP
jgi:hypothetical protein